MSLHPVRRAATLALALSAVAAISFASSASHACRCMLPPGPKEAMAKVDAVFLGKVVREAAGTAGNKTFQLQVTRSWKGDVRGRARVVTASHSSACGVPFQRGQEYLVYAGLDKTARGSFTTNTCSRTRLRSAAAEDLQILGAGQRPGRRLARKTRRQARRAQRRVRRQARRQRRKARRANRGQKSVVGKWTAKGKWTVELELGADGRFVKRDLVSPCPANARCIWSGIVTNQGTYQARRQQVALTYEKADNRSNVTTPRVLRRAGKTLVEKLKDGSLLRYEIAGASSGGSGVACGPSTCAQGQVCCNASCGICTPPGGMCTKQFCGAATPTPVPATK